MSRFFKTSFLNPVEDFGYTPNLDLIDKLGREKVAQELSLDALKKSINFAPGIDIQYNIGDREIAMQKQQEYQENRDKMVQSFLKNPDDPNTLDELRTFSKDFSKNFNEEGDLYKIKKSKENIDNLLKDIEKHKAMSIQQGKDVNAWTDPLLKKIESYEKTGGLKNRGDVFDEKFGLQKEAALTDYTSSTAFTALKASSKLRELEKSLNNTDPNNPDYYKIKVQYDKTKELTKQKIINTGKEYFEETRNIDYLKRDEELTGSKWLNDKGEIDWNNPSSDAYKYLKSLEEYAYKEVEDKDTTKFDQGKLAVENMRLAKKAKEAAKKAEEDGGGTTTVTTTRFSKTEEEIHKEANIYTDLVNKSLVKDENGNNKIDLGQLNEEEVKEFTRLDDIYKSPLYNGEASDKLLTAYFKDLNEEYDLDELQEITPSSNDVNKINLPKQFNNEEFKEIIDNLSPEERVQYINNAIAYNANSLKTHKINLLWPTVTNPISNRDKNKFKARPENAKTFYTEEVIQDFLETVKTSNKNGEVMSLKDAGYTKDDVTFRLEPKFQNYLLPTIKGSNTNNVRTVYDNEVIIEDGEELKWSQAVLNESKVTSKNLVLDKESKNKDHNIAVLSILKQSLDEKHAPLFSKINLTHRNNKGEARLTGLSQEDSLKDLLKFLKNSGDPTSTKEDESFLDSFNVQYTSKKANTVTFTLIPKNDVVKNKMIAAKLGDYTGGFKMTSNPMTNADIGKNLNSQDYETRKFINVFKGNIEIKDYDIIKQNVALQLKQKDDTLRDGYNSFTTPRTNDTYRFKFIYDNGTKKLKITKGNSKNFINNNNIKEKPFKLISVKDNNTAEEDFITKVIMNYDRL